MQRLLYTKPLKIESLREIAHSLGLVGDSWEFSGSTLDVGSSRELSQAIELGSSIPKSVVLASYTEISESSFHVLLKCLEDSACSVVVAATPPFPETFSSRFIVQDVKGPSLYKLYQDFSEITSAENLKIVYQEYSYLNQSVIRRQYDKFREAITHVKQLMEGLYDGSYEVCLRTASNFSREYLPLLFLELEHQLNGSTLTGLPLLGLGRDKTLTLLNLRKKMSHVPADVITTKISLRILASG